MEREELICRVHVVEMSRLAFVLALLSLAVLHSGVVNGQGKVVIAVCIIPHFGPVATARAFCTLLDLAMWTRDFVL